MIRREALLKKAKTAEQLVRIHRRVCMRMVGFYNSDQIVSDLREAADHQERLSMRASERARMPLLKRLVTR